MLGLVRLLRLLGWWPTPTRLLRPLMPLLALPALLQLLSPTTPLPPSTTLPAATRLFRLLETVTG